MSEIVKYADVYFCSGYNRDFFVNNTFSPPYRWLEYIEVDYYVRRAKGLIATYGEHFDRVKPFVPICPNMYAIGPSGRLNQKIRNAYDKAYKIVNVTLPWRLVLKGFEVRYDYLIKLRSASLLYDIVLQDTLWGWPRHRYALHQQLRGLAADGRKIHAKLHWGEPLAMDGSNINAFAAGEFPFETGCIDNYESMLASSRLAVFATGLHWGWRSVMTLALMFGIPVYTDRIILEPWFCMDTFKLIWNDTVDWGGVRETLDLISDGERAIIREHNQAVFDEFLGPERVAKYFIDTALEANSRNS